MIPAVVAITALSGCGGDKGTPTNPSQPPGLTVVTGVRYDADFTREASAVRLRWNTVPGATAYRIEVGSSAAASDVLVMDAPAPPVRLSLPPQRRLLYARVRALDGSTLGPAMVDYRLSLTDFLSAAEALLIGTGVSSPGTPGASSPSGTVPGWRRGATVRVVIFRSASPAVASGIRTGVEATATMTAGAVNASLDESAEDAPSATATPPADTVWVYGLDRASLQQVCGPNGFACFAPGFNNRIDFRHGRIVTLLGEGSAGRALHEWGHALGFAHVFSPVPRPDESVELPENRDSGTLSIMASSIDARFTDLDVEVMQSFYRAGLSAGATRSQLQAVGLAP